MFDRNALFEHYPELESIRADIEKATELLATAARTGRMIMTCGNGGSCADSGHIVGELMKGFLLRRPLTQAEVDAFAGSYGEAGRTLAIGLQGTIKSIALTDQTAILSAFANDCAPENMYAQLAYGYAEEGGALIGLSTSGNSKNVVTAAMSARIKGSAVIAMVGEKPCKLDDIADVCIHVPSCETYRIQEYHLPIYHYLCAAVEDEMFKK